MKSAPFTIALVLQVLAQSVGGIWGAAIAGALTGLVVRGAGGFRTGALSAATAVLLLLTVAGMRGASIVPFAGMIGANFNLPGWGILALALLLPALQAGGLAGGVARLVERTPPRS
jgi:hypothetical protein